MRRTSIIAAAIGSLVASSAFAGFTVTLARTSVDATFDRVDLYALNTGGDTGTGLLAVELTSTATAGEAVWRSTTAGNWNPLNSADTVNRSQVRVDPEDVSSSSLVSKTPSANQPLAAQYGGSTVALGNFGVVIAGLSGSIPPQSPVTGNLFASLFVSKAYAATLSGNVGGSAGSKVGFSVTTGTVANNPPVITPGNTTVNVVFGQIVTNGAPFSANVNITDPEGDAITAALGALPPSVTNATITPGAGGTYTIAGTVAYSAANGPDVVVPFSASATGGTANGTITLHVTPEPTSLSLIGLSGLLMGRRRK